MSDSLDAEEAPGHLPFLSHSRVSRYLHCPEQYRLYYIESLRLKRPAAALVFGQAIHVALARLLGKDEDAIKVFESAWEQAKPLDLTFTSRESWQGLRATGEQLLEKFLKNERRRLTSILAVEKPFRLAVTALPVPFVGIIDLIAEMDGQATVVDFKTSGSRYEADDVILSDQLTAYQITEPETTRTGLCVFLKLKEPRVEWQFAERNGSRLTEYLAKVALVTEEIAARRFYKRPGRWCAWCDYLPVCTGDRAKAEETLTRVR